MAAKTLAALKADPRVKEVWQEDDGFCERDRGPRTGRQAYWVALAPGWRDTEADVITLHECTVAALWERLELLVRTW